LTKWIKVLDLVEKRAASAEEWKKQGGLLARGEEARSA